MAARCRGVLTPERETKSGKNENQKKKQKPEKQQGEGVY
jgi:hypothetical protein